MKIPRSTAKALTLVEVMVALAVMAITGVGVFEILRMGLILFAKNSAINLSHNEGRFCLDNLEQDLAASPSTPQLTDSNGTVITTSSGAGISFQAYAGPGAFCLYSGQSAITSSNTSLQVVTGTSSATNFKPLPGMVIHIQAQAIAGTLVEAKLGGSAPYPTTTTSSGVVTTITLASALGGSGVSLQDPVTSVALNVACFFTTPVRYAVMLTGTVPGTSTPMGQLVRYTLDQGGSGGMVGTNLAYNITTAQPFSMPAVNSSPSDTFVLISNLTGIDSSSNQRQYKAVTTPFTAQFSHFAQLTVQY